MLYREIIAVCSPIHTKHINTLCGQNVELLNVKLTVHLGTTGFEGFLQNSVVVWLSGRQPHSHILQSTLAKRYCISFCKAQNLQISVYSADSHLRNRRKVEKTEPLVSGLILIRRDQSGKKKYFIEIGNCEGYKSRILRFTKIETLLVSVHEHRNTSLSVLILLLYGKNRIQTNYILNFYDSQSIVWVSK